MTCAALAAHVLAQLVFTCAAELVSASAAVLAVAFATVLADVVPCPFVALAAQMVVLVIAYAVRAAAALLAPAAPGVHAFAANAEATAPAIVRVLAL